MPKDKKTPLSLGMFLNDNITAYLLMNDKELKDMEILSALKKWFKIFEKAGYSSTSMKDNGQEAIWKISLAIGIIRLVKEVTNVEIGLVESFNKNSRKFIKDKEMFLKENAIAGSSAADVLMYYNINDTEIIFAGSSKYYTNNISIKKVEISDIIHEVNGKPLNKGVKLVTGLAHSGLCKPRPTTSEWQKYIDASVVIETEELFENFIKFMKHFKNSGLKADIKNIINFASTYQPVYMFDSVAELNKKIDAVDKLLNLPQDDSDNESSNDISRESDTEDSSPQREIAELKEKMEKMRIEIEKLRIKNEEQAKIIAERDATPDTKEDEAAMDTTSESSNDISGEFSTDTEEDEENEEEKDALKAECEELVDIYSEKAPYNDWKVNINIRNFYHSINNTNPSISELKEYRDKIKAKLDKL